MSPEEDTIRIPCRLLRGQFPDEFLVRVQVFGVNGERTIEVLADRRYISFEAEEPTQENPEVEGHVIAWRLTPVATPPGSGPCQSRITVGLPGEPWGPRSKTVVTVLVPA